MIDMHEEIIWNRVETQLPDDYTTVLINTLTEDEPVWLGYHDDCRWYLIDGYAVPDCAVVAWAHLPAGIEAAE